MQMSRNNSKFELTDLAKPKVIQGVTTTTHPLHDLRMKQYNTLAAGIVNEMEYKHWEPKEADQGRVTPTDHTTLQIFERS